MRIVMKNGDEVYLEPTDWAVTLAGLDDEWVIEYSDEWELWEFILLVSIRSVQATSTRESGAVNQVNNLLRMQNGEPV